jgi:hypothetical protein
LLQTLSLANNQLTGSLVSFAANTQLQTLQLGFNRLSGGLGSLDLLSATVETLSLPGNSFVSLLPAMTQLRKLSTLDLSGTRVSNGLLPDAWFQRCPEWASWIVQWSDALFPDLSNFVCQNCSLTSPVKLIIQSMLLWRNIRVIDLSNNKIGDKFHEAPFEFFQGYETCSSQKFKSAAPFPVLSTLDLSSNDLSGFIPRFDLPQLSSLLLSNNPLLQGAIPDTWRNIRYLNISKTAMSSPNAKYPSWMKFNLNARVINSTDSSSCPMVIGRMGTETYVIDHFYDLFRSCSCASGFYDRSDDFSCRACPPGKWSSVDSTVFVDNSAQKAVCEPCAVGTYSENERSVACIQAPPGRYVAHIGATSTQGCPNNAVCENGLVKSLTGFWAAMEKNNYSVSPIFFGRVSPVFVWRCS